MATIIVGSKLPNGLVLKHPLKTEITVVIRGKSAAPRMRPNGPPLIVDYMTTEVDAEFWETWKVAHKDFAPLKSGAIFEAKTSENAKAMAKATEKLKTGFEPRSQESDGVKPANKKAE